MLWYKKFDYNMKDDLKVMCNEYTEQFDSTNLSGLTSQWQILRCGLFHH